MKTIILITKAILTISAVKSINKNEWDIAILKIIISALLTQYM